MAKGRGSGTKTQQEGRATLVEKLPSSPHHIEYLEVYRMSKSKCVVGSILVGLLLLIATPVLALSSLDWQYYSSGGAFSYPGGVSNGSFTADGSLGGTFIGETEFLYFDIYATSTQITFDYIQREGIWTLSDNSYNVDGLTIDNGILLTENIDTITSVTVNDLTNMSGFSSANVTFNSSNIAVDWEGLSFSSSTLVVLDVGGSQPVPEPATMLLLGSGLIGLVGFRRRFGKNKQTN
jgi:hypothetical protein